MKKYRVNKIFYSIQGEGRRTGTPQVFLRFAGCNLKCSFCDTDHEPYTEMTAEEIYDECKKAGQESQKRWHCNNISFCGGEPTLQLDERLIKHFAGWYKSIETNGLKPIPLGVDYVVCSPKTKPKTIKARGVDELRFVIAYGDPIPDVDKFDFAARRYYLSPCFDGEAMNALNVLHTVQMVKDNPQFHLSIQSHKFINIE